jgi:hypothetical protein
MSIVLGLLDTPSYAPASQGKPKMRGRKLRSDINWQGALKQKKKSVQQTDVKQDIGGRVSICYQPRLCFVFVFIGWGTSGYEKLFLAFLLGKNVWKTLVCCHGFTLIFYVYSY